MAIAAPSPARCAELLDGLRPNVGRVADSRFHEIGAGSGQIRGALGGRESPTSAS